MTGNNWAVILAAGSSKRMGSQKLLLPYRKSTIIGTVVDNVLASSIDKVMVVLGADREKVMKALENKPVEFIYNEEHPNGMLSSVLCGMPLSMPTMRISMGSLFRFITTGADTHSWWT
jgi:CTP:molybdopterin cytidylyltransferase MocA